MNMNKSLTKTYQVRDVLNQLPGVRLNLSKARTWLTESFLAPLGYGIRSEIELDAHGQERLRVFGFTKRLS